MIVHCELLSWENDKAEMFAIPESANVSMIVELTGGKLIAEVHGTPPKFTIKTTDGKIIGSEDWQGDLTAERIKERAEESVEFFKKEQRFNAMSRIIFYGMQKGIPNDESTKAANAFGECIDAGKNPDECVNELKGKYPWLIEINFSDFILLYGYTAESPESPVRNLKKTGTPVKNMNISTIENVILRKEEIRSVIGEEYEGVGYEFINNSTPKMFVQTPCADYFVLYDFVNDSVISIDKATIGKKTIKEEAVSEEEGQRFLAIALNDSRVKEALKGRNFSVSITKYVMYAACQRARDPDSVHMTFRVDSELYRVILLPHKDELEVARVMIV